MRTLLTLSLIFWPWMQEVTGHYNKGAGGGTPAPVVAVAISNTSSTANVTASLTVPSGTTMVLIDAWWNSSSLTLTTMRDCSGSTQCSSSTDTLATGFACTVLGSTTMCSEYVCVSALSAGTNAFSVFISGAPPQTLAIGVRIITGAHASGCYDTNGSGNATGTNPSISTSGNAALSNELGTAFIVDSVAPSVGTINGVTALSDRFSGGLGMESSNTALSTGSATTATFTASSGTWQGIVELIKP